MRPFRLRTRTLLVFPSLISTIMPHCDPARAAARRALTLALRPAERTRPMPRSADHAGTDLLHIDDELSEEERLVRDTVRAFAADRIMPNIADWFEAGTLPRELVPELGQLGLLGMHLTGYGCAGMGPIAYGVTCREMEAADSGLRSLVSVQVSLARVPIWKYRSVDQKHEWVPPKAARPAR